MKDLSFQSYSPIIPQVPKEVKYRKEAPDWHCHPIDRMNKPALNCLTTHGACLHRLRPAVGQTRFLQVSMLKRLDSYALARE